MLITVKVPITPRSPLLPLEQGVEMARGIKTLGMHEIEAFRKRVIRQYSMERISRADHDFLIDAVDGIKARIVKMDEKGGETEQWL